MGPETSKIHIVSTTALKFACSPRFAEFPVDKLFLVIDIGTRSTIRLYCTNCTKIAE